MKAILIDQIKKLLDPRPDWLTFRHIDFDDYGKISDPAGLFEHKGQKLTRDQCMRIPAKKHIFLMRHIRSK